MINTLTKLAQKPSDKNIRITRIIFAIILIAIITLGWNITAVNFGIPKYIEYAFYIFPAIGLIRGIADPGIFRKKIWKWTIFGLGVAMLLISLVLIDDISPISAPIVPATNGTISLDSIPQTAPSLPFSLSTDNWFGFFGVILMIVGFALNGKNITKKNERFGEIVKKIRV